MRIAIAAVVLSMSACSPVTNVLGTTDAGQDGGPPITGKPNLMFLIDKSGSMNFAANDQVAPCTPGCNTSGNPACVAGCRTRLQELKLAMQTFLDSSNAPVGWMGMAIYPTAAANGMGVVDQCGATTSADIRVQLAPMGSDLAADMSAAAASVNNQIQSLTVGGGTPTGDSLKFLGTYAPLSDPNRHDYVVLITDGLPNCNAMNVNSCNNPAACKCTLGTSGAGGSNCVPVSFCVQGCLDKGNSASQIAQLRQKNIKTIVIGFGADTASGDGPDTLNAMAEAGGFARACPNQTDAECGTGNTCNMATKLCAKKFYQATSAAELAAAMADMVKLIP